MKDLKKFIYETSINAKKRNVNFIKNLLLNGKNVGKIGSFVIFTAENPSSVQRSGKENKKLMNDFNKELMKQEKIIDPIIFNKQVKEIAEDMFIEEY